MTETRCAACDGGGYAITHPSDPQQLCPVCGGQGYVR